MGTVKWDETYDFVVVGSGAGSVVASLVMKRAGFTSAILEKQQIFGGTTALSGGVMWIPCNPLLGDRDNPALARQYMDAVIGDVGPASSPARRDAYIREGRRMVEFLMRHGMKFIDAEVADYHYGVYPGGVIQGRAILAPLFDLRRIGTWKDAFGESWRSPSLPVSSHEITELAVARHNWRGRFIGLQLIWRILVERLTGRKLRGSGRALQASLLEIAIREQVAVSLGTEVREIILDEGRVVGVAAKRDGKGVLIGARRGVLLNAGGFARNSEMRKKYLPHPTEAEWSFVGPGDTGEILRMAMALGAATSNMDAAWWCPTCMPFDASKPHFMVVDKMGRRFCNEANSYSESGQHIYAQKAFPAFGIFDGQFKSSYLLGALGLQTWQSAKKHVASGALIEAPTIADLARQTGIDPAGLQNTITRFNGFCATGIDEDFHKGEIAFNHKYGDPSNRPNPCLGTIAKPPFYSIKIWPQDVGTSGGLLTDEHARVLREDGSPIAGLYATGNTTASVMGFSYLGAGATIGPSITFGYIAANHAAA